MVSVKQRKIHVIKGTGEGATELAAFDSALLDCGIGNYNIIRLSSVIPPNRQIVKSDQLAEKYGVWGDKAYVVYAYQSAVQPGTEAWAGIAWVILEPNGAGLFVEHEAETAQECRDLLRLTLEELCTSRGKVLTDFEHDMCVVGTICKDKPSAAMVAAIYDTKGWGV